MIMISAIVDTVRQSVNWEMAPNDPMFSGSDAHYRSVGESALKIILGSLSIADRPLPKSVLDFASASGRVTRWLRAAFPQADLHVADIEAEWTAWTAKTFGAFGWPSASDLAVVQAPRRYDLIWCGSLATHLSAERTGLLLRKFHDWLEPHGIAVVTMHGRQAAAFMVSGRLSYFAPHMNDASRLELLRAYGNDGYGYVDYDGQSYGISMNSLEWAIGAVHKFNARVVAAAEHAWDGHHDIIAFQKAA